MFRSFGGTRLTTRASILICPASDLLETGEAPERRGLPAAGRPNENQELAVLDQEIEVVDGDRTVGIGLGQVVEGDCRHRPRMLTGESFRAKALEVSDELLTFGEEAALGQDSRAHASLHALHEASVLQAYLVVERQQLVDPSLDRRPVRRSSRETEPSARDRSGAWGRRRGSGVRERRSGRNSARGSETGCAAPRRPRGTSCRSGAVARPDWTRDRAPRAGTRPVKRRRRR